VASGKKRPDGVARAKGRAQGLSAEADAKAQMYLDRAPRCTVCGNQMASYGRTTHFLCDPTAVEGRSCICREDCTRRVYGDGPTPCDNACEVCRILRGQVHRSSKSKSPG